MTGRGHRIVTFMAIGGATGSPLAAAIGTLSSRLPDSMEYLIFGGARNRFHRKYTHWFVPWLAMAAFCFYSAAQSPGPVEYGPENFWDGVVPKAEVLMAGGARFAWDCAAFWFLGPLLHILEDACCGKVPFLLPWRRSVGVRLFRMSPKGGMSYGERMFTLIACLMSLAAWFGHGIIL